MKNLLFIVTSLLLLSLASCEKDEQAASPSSINEQEIDHRSPPTFITLCHLKPDGSYISMDVPQQALQTHLSHGDRYADADGDGFSWVGACLGSADDCDDDNPTIHPGVTEVCDGIDNDCDGDIDGDDLGVVGQSYFHPDPDGDGFGSSNVSILACVQPAGTVTTTGDCNNFDDTVYPGAPEIANDGIDQDCDGSDYTPVVYGPCDCFTMEELQQVYQYTPWPFGWWSDVPGSCKDAPYDQLMEVWITNVGQPSQNFNFSVQAGTINGLPFASQARFNHLTGQFDELCGGYTNAQNASNCAQILHDFIAQMRNSHPTWDYCIRFP